MEVSLKIAQKLSRYGWQKLQTKLAYVKRCRCTIYDLTEKRDKYDFSFDSPDIGELRLMGTAIGFESEINDPDSYASGLIEYLKASKQKLTDCRITGEMP